MVDRRGVELAVLGHGGQRGGAEGGAGLAEMTPILAKAVAGK
ncbi:hypothetical protein [Streptomyces sp. NPDC046887]